MSPDGKYVLRETLREPFSELVGYNQFARAQEVIDLDGKVIAEVSKTPLREASRAGGPAAATTTIARARSRGVRTAKACR